MDPTEQILQKAEQIFLQRGFYKVSMDELAAELRMSKKTVYQHFSGKDELLGAMLKRRMERVGAEVARILDSPVAFPEKFRSLIQLIHRRIGEVQPVFLEDLQRHAPEQFRGIEEFRGRMLPVYFGRILDEGTAAGLLRTDLNRELFIRVLVSTIQTLVRPNVLMELRLHPWEGLDGILQLFFEGALTPTGRRACGKYFKS